MTEPRLSAWPPLPLNVYARSPSSRLPYPLHEPECRLFAWGRHALWHGAKALGLGPGDEVLVPAYHHGSEVEVLARAGIWCRFYETDDLEPDAEALDRMLAPAVRALHLIHYLGFPQDGPRWRRWCKERGLLLIEDAAQAWLSSCSEGPVGSFGDLAIFCLYKSFGLPEGGALMCESPPPAAPIDRRFGIGEVARRHAAWVAQRSRLMTSAALAMRRAHPYDPESDFSLRDPASTLWASVPFLLPRLADEQAAVRRRANYRLLLSELESQVPAPFADLEDRVSPLAFPVETENKAALLARLERHGIKALDLWSVPHPTLPAADFPHAARRRSTTVALPVHQELSLRDLDRIATAARQRPAAPRLDLRLEPITDLDAASAEWSELAGRSGNVFATWEWVSILWRHFGDGRPLLATACRRPGGELVGILPLYLSARRPARTIRFVGHGVGDYLGPICERENAAAVARGLRKLLATASWDWDLLLGEHLPAQLGWGAMLGGRVLRRDPAPVLRIEGASWNEFLASRSSNFRGQVRRRERKLAREHELRYRLADQPDRLSQDLDLFFALHEARWSRDSAGSSVFAGRLRAFHTEWAACALKRGWLRLWIMEVDERPVAAWYGMRFGGADWYYQAGRDPAWDRYAVGAVLLAHSIRESFSDGMREYKFLSGGEAYKGRFANEDPGLETIALARGVRGEASLLGMRTALALPPAGRRGLEKLAS